MAAPGTQPEFMVFFSTLWKRVLFDSLISILLLENRSRSVKKPKVDPTAHLEDAIVDLKSIRDSHRREFKKIMDNIGRNRCLVIKKEQLRLINLVVKGVVKINSVYLEPEFRCPADAKNVIYIIWPDVESLQMIAHQIKNQRNLIGPEDGRTFHIVMIPSITVQWRTILEDVLDIVNLICFPCDLIPLDRDLISCSIPNVIRSSYLNRDYQPLSLLAEALLKMEILFGRFTERHAKGKILRFILKLCSPPKFACFFCSSFMSNFVRKTRYVRFYFSYHYKI